MRYFTLILVLILLSGFSSSEELLSKEWEYHLNSGAGDITIFDLSGEGVPEIYAVSYHPTRSSISVIDPEGFLIYDMQLPRYMNYLYTTEEIKIAYVDNIDDDPYLDIFSASEIHTGGINLHYLYGVEREPERGLDRYYNRVKWQTKESGLPTRIRSMDYEGKRRIITSSIDHNIRVFNDEGVVIAEELMEGSVWDVFPANLDDDEKTEYVAGVYKQIVALDDNWQPMWTYPTEERFRKVLAADIDEDGKPEVLGMDEDGLTAFTRTGDKLWSFKAEGGVDLSTLQIYGGGVKSIVLATRDKLYFIDENGAEIWSYDVNDIILSFARLYVKGQGHMLVGTNDNIMSFKVNERYFKEMDSKTSMSLATNYYKSGKYADAIEYAEKAKKLFNELGEFESYKKADKIILDSKTILDAEANYAKSLEYYKNGDFERSAQFANMAITLFRKMSMDDGVKKTKDILANMEDKEKADGYYDEAEKLFLNNEFGKATELVDKAIEIYTRLNDQDALTKTTSLKNLVTSHYTTTTQRTVVTTTIPERGITQDDLIMYGALGLSVLFVLIAASTILKKS
ncbi:MAG: hypothetical protein ABIH11_05440 [Candidatus Altiarchaeota archaeon]